MAAAFPAAAAARALLVGAKLTRCRAGQSNNMTHVLMSHAIFRNARMLQLQCSLRQYVYTG